MKNTLRVSCLLFSILLISCDQKKTDTAADESTSTPVVLTTDTTQQTPVSGNENNITVTSPTPTPVPAPAGPAAAAQPVAAGMNPAHGQPGHRCDIAVGAPLNSAPQQAPASAPTIVNSPQPTAVPAPQPAANVPTAPGMNPPHGQPGHDCAIAVGAPLKK